jgi:hypothetical protein
MSLPLGILSFVVVAAPILLGVFLASVWVAVITIVRAFLWWTGRSQRRTLVRELALISAPLTYLSARGAQVERRRGNGESRIEP